MKQILLRYEFIDIESNIDIIKHNNAFIMRDGSFYLVKGYTGNNPSHQLESSALAVARKEIAYDIRSEYDKWYSENNTSLNKLYYLRSILVHHYGYALFARHSSDGKGKYYYEHSLVSDPKYNGMHVSGEQLKTLRRLFEINDYETDIHSCGLSNYGEEAFQKVLRHGITKDGFGSYKWSI